MKEKKSFLQKIDPSLINSQDNILHEDYTFHYINIEKDEYPAEFFTWALKSKLYKSAKNINFTSHMKVIFENSLENFNGISAVVAMSNKTNKPVSIALLKHFIDNKSTRKSSQEFTNLFNTEPTINLKKPKMIVESEFPALIHKAGLKHQDNRERINPWKKQLDFHIIHLGFAMLYTKPTHRLKSLSKQAWRLLEGEQLKRVSDKSSMLPDSVINNDILISVTAKGQAFDIVKKHSKNFIPSSYDNLYISNIVSDISYVKHFEERFESKVVTDLKAKKQNKVKL